MEPMQNPEVPDGVERESSRLSAERENDQEDAFRFPNPGTNGDVRRVLPWGGRGRLALITAEGEVRGIPCKTL